MPKYLNLTQNEWKNKISAGLKILENCSLCPNMCKVDRISGRKGICKSGFFCKISSAFAHFGEEPPISGDKGSGTIFFSGCTMKCAYCQNYPLSQQEVGAEMPFEKIAGYMIGLQSLGCHNINLVTPTHYIPQIIASLEIAVSNGLNIPIVYNTSGYESEEGLELLDGIIDIYLPDLRYSTDSSAKKYSGVNNYVKNVRRSIKTMSIQTGGKLVLDENGIAVSGLIIRMLILPNLANEAKDNMAFLATELPDMPHISLMSQYFPTWKAQNHNEINRAITEDEFMDVYSCMESYGLTEGWVQDIN